MHQTRMGTSSNMQQLYSLTWSEFSTSMVASMQSLRGHADFVDVTLAAGGRSFPAHKIVLSAASPFLLDILKSTPCKHPVVFMAGVAAADLEALLEFVYRGEVSIDPAQLPSLLQAATCLNIQGLVPNIPHAAKSAEDKGVPLVKTDASREMISSFLPVRRRKRIKRRESPGTGGKWSRSDGDENSADQAAAAAAGDGAAGEQSATTKGDGTGENLTAEELAIMGNSDPNAIKARAASEQPGACPECGAILRQARNLRRHLLTGCKHRADLDSDKDSDVSYLDPKTLAECHYHDENSGAQLHQTAAGAGDTGAKATHQHNSTISAAAAIVKPSHQSGTTVTKPLHHNATNIVKPHQQVVGTVVKPHHHNVSGASKSHHQHNAAGIAKPHHHHDVVSVPKPHLHNAASVAKTHPYYTESIPKHYQEPGNIEKPHSYDNSNIVKHYQEPSNMVKPHYQDLSSGSKLHYGDDNRVAKHQYHEPANVVMPHFLDESNRLMLHYYGMNSVGKSQYMDPNNSAKPQYLDENNVHMPHFGDNMSQP